MMALIYAVQGSFWPLLAVHLADLGIGGRDRGWIFATLAIASMRRAAGGRPARGSGDGRPSACCR